MSEKRNIVVITLDSLRADHCSFMGYHRETTPTIDKMARKGLYFENAVAASVPTAPSIMACFTGDYSLNNAIDFTAEKWRKEIALRKTLAEVLLEKGYETVAFHANPYVSSYFGFNKGFKLFVDFVKENEIEIIKSDSKLKTFVWSIKKIIKKESSCIPWEKYYDKIINTVKKLKEPYFLWVLLLDTHTPYYPPKHFKHWCKTNSLYLTYIYWKLYKQDWKLDIKDERIINAYDDCIRYADAFVKRLWDDLENTDPIFIIHADHGDGFGEHGFYHHPPMLYEELIHVPLVIYNTDLKGKVEKPVSLLGLVPAVLELIEEKNEFPSKSILNSGEDYVISKVFEKGKRKIAVRTKRWKFIVGQKNVDELYDLKKDPNEQENLIDEHPDLAREMKEIVKRHIKHEMEKMKVRRIAHNIGVRI